MMMNKRKISRGVLLLVLVLLCAGGSVAQAQTGGGYGLVWNTIDGGGTVSTGGGYSLTGTIGQPDAGSLAGGGYSLSGGFWTVPWSGAYLPLVAKP
jgi:hypothetical protein